MTDFAWMITNIGGSAIVSMLAAYLMGAHAHRFNMFERIGIGLTGGTMLLMVGPILAKNGVVSASPFDDWAKIALEVGIALSYIGIIARMNGLAPASRLAPPIGQGWFNRNMR